MQESNEINQEVNLETLQNTVDNIAYLSYKISRLRSPHIPVESWGKVYGISNTALYEIQFQKEERII